MVKLDIGLPSYFVRARNLVAYSDSAWEYGAPTVCMTYIQVKKEAYVYWTVHHCDS